MPAEPEEQRVDEQVRESFPGSDAPASTMGHGEASATSAATLLAAAIGERDAAGVADYCDEACTLTWGGRDVVGREAIREALTALFAEQGSAHLKDVIVGAEGSALELAFEDPTRRACWVVRPALPSFTAIHVYSNRGR